MAESASKTTPQEQITNTSPRKWCARNNYDFVGLVTASVGESHIMLVWFGIVPVLVVLRPFLCLSACDWLLSAVVNHSFGLIHCSPLFTPNNFSLLLLISTFHFTAYACVYMYLCVCVFVRMCNELCQHELSALTQPHKHKQSMWRHDEQSVISKFPKGFDAIF